jgi:hypothetical protein
VEELLISVTVNDIRQIEIHIAETLVPGISHLEVEIAIAKLKKYKSAGSDQIPAELIKAGGKTLLLRSINSLILFGIRKKYWISGRSLLLYQFTERRIRLSVVNYCGISFS